MYQKRQKTCCLEKLRMGEVSTVRKGDELEIITKTGRKFKGILFDFKEGYVQTIAQMGILMFFPVHSLMNVYQL